MRGRQKRRKTSIESRQTTAEAISTRVLSTKFDQKNCVIANETPQTRIAGMTSSVSRQGTMKRTSQIGTMMLVKGMA